MRLAALAWLIVLAGCTQTAGTVSADDNGAVYAAWAAARSHVEVVAQGTVARDLGVRRGPSGTHEGFLLHLRGGAGRGLTVRIEDNTDITGPIPIVLGDEVRVRGEYIYDKRGGLIHWTHHDPRLRHEPGFIEIHGKKYQ